MRNLLKLLYAYHFLILFIILESFSLFLIIQGSTFHHARFINSSRALTGSIYSTLDDIKSYIGLKQENFRLAQENTLLKNQLELLRKTEKVQKDTFPDTLHQKKYVYYLAQVVNNSVNKQYNYITLNRGARDGVTPDMGVISDKGVVGIVQGVSENYSTVLSVLNMAFTISAKIKKNGYFGLLHWNGISDRICILDDIPQHVSLSKGDTIVTTGYSGIFPENLLLGTISDFELKGGNFYSIKVLLFNDFRNLNYVTLIDDIKKEEKLILEKTTGND